MTNDPLSRFEDHIQRLVEGGFARLFAGRLHPHEVAVQLARAMEDRAQARADGSLIAPDIYTVRLNPQDHEAVLSARPELAQSLSKELIELARRGGLHLTGLPEVRLVADSTVGPHHVTVTAQVRLDRTETTQGASVGEVNQDTSAPKALLIISGNRHVPIEKPILNIGRQQDNDIILNQPSVSRHHAQIRLRFGRYMLFDLGSTRGTTVNGTPVREAILQSGDVINLAGITLIYIEEASAEPPPSSFDAGSTQPYSPI